MTGVDLLRKAEVQDYMVLLLCEGTSVKRSLDAIRSQFNAPVHAEDLSEVLSEQSRFAERYDQARLIGTDVIAQETVEIADSEPDPQRARVRVDARKWLASKQNPRRYGDSLNLNVTETPDLQKALEQAKARLAPGYYEKLKQEQQDSQSVDTDCQSVLIPRPIGHRDDGLGGLDDLLE